jgi:hypothetical protein
LENLIPAPPPYITITPPFRPPERTPSSTFNVSRAFLCSVRETDVFRPSDNTNIHGLTHKRSCRQSLHWHNFNSALKLELSSHRPIFISPFSNLDIAPLCRLEKNSIPSFPHIQLFLVATSYQPNWKLSLEIVPRSRFSFDANKPCPHHRQANPFTQCQLTPPGRLPCLHATAFHLSSQYRHSQRCRPIPRSNRLSPIRTNEHLVLAGTAC